LGATKKELGDVPNSFVRTVRGVNRTVLGDKISAIPIYDTLSGPKMQVFGAKINIYFYIIILYY
jgi:hypothetical protein